MSALGPTPTTHRLRVTLMDVEPAVWRELRVPSVVPLSLLHAVVQVAVGWEDAHLHEWRVGERTYVPHGEEDWGEGALDESAATLADVAPADSVLHYLYDMTDGWEHVVEVLDVEPWDATTPPLECLAGEGAAPPEEVEGPFGYEHLIDAYADPDDVEHDSVVEALGTGWDPRHFDRHAVNERLEDLWRAA